MLRYLCFFFLFSSLYAQEPLSGKVYDSILAIKKDKNYQHLFAYGESIKESHPELSLFAKADAYKLKREYHKALGINKQLFLKNNANKELRFRYGLRIVSTLYLLDELEYYKEMHDYLELLEGIKKVYPINHRYLYSFHSNYYKYYIALNRLQAKRNNKKIDEHLQGLIYHAEQTEDPVLIRRAYMNSLDQFIDNKLAKTVIQKGVVLALDYLKKHDSEDLYFIYSLAVFYYLQEHYLESMQVLNTVINNDTSPVAIHFTNLDAIAEKDFYFYEIIIFINSFIRSKYASTSGDTSQYYNAFQSIQACDYLLDKMYLNTSNNTNKTYWRKRASERYFMGVYTANAMDDVENMHYFMEKNKSLFLLDQLNYKESHKNIPDSILKVNRALKKEVFELESLVSNSKNVSDSLQLHVLERRDALNQQEEQILGEFPNFKPLTIPKLLRIAEVQNALTNEEVTLSYIWDKDEDDFDDAFGLCITKHSVTKIPIKGLDSLAIMVDRFRSALNKPIDGVQEQKEFHSNAYQLYQTLIPENVQALIKGKKLIIVPDSDLYGIPFEALVTSLESKTYLIEETTISYANSLTYLMEQRQRNPAQTNSAFAAYAPVDFPSDSLTRLSESKKEVTAISKMFHRAPYLAQRASLDSFQELLPNTNILHLATHGTVNRKDPWIAFYEDKLYLHDLYTMETQAELVTLSACETGVGAIEEGEGVMSIARGFFHAGAKSVVSSLWQVNETSTSEIMQDFYTNLKAGDNKAKALRDAKLSYLRKQEFSEASPYYWASFVCVGDTSPITIPNTYSIRYWILGGAFLLGLLWFFLFKRK